MNIQEKLYSYLAEADRPIGLGELNKQEEFKEIPRQELSRILQDLKRQNRLFRSVKEGKAYYSVNSAEGVGRNASQQFIASLAALGNKELSATEEQDFDREEKHVETEIIHTENIPLI